MMGIQRCAPIRFTTTLLQTVPAVKIIECTSVLVLIPDIPKPRSAGRPSDIAFAIKNIEKKERVYRSCRLTDICSIHM